MKQDLREVAIRATFPIRDRAELRQLLGEDASLTVRGRVLPVNEALALLPTYYFPIGSEADLVSKFADLAACIPTSEQEFVGEWQERTGEQTGVSPVDCWS
jgi:hypothetical protein